MVAAIDAQHLFLQAVLSRGIISEKLARTLWEKSVEAVRAADDSLEIHHSPEQAAWLSFVTKVNQSLDSLDFEFRCLADELTGKNMYALVNRRGDEIAQLATHYSAHEIAYFKGVVEQIMLAPNEAYSVSSLAALREVNSLKPVMSKTQAEIVLGSFVAKGWLIKSKRGRYSLGTRTLLELFPYLKSTYPDEIIECTICTEMTTHGIACNTRNCQVRMHYHCFEKFRKIKTACPTCNTAWPADAHNPQLIPVGEGAVKEGQDDGKRRVRVRSPADSDEEGEEDMFEDDDDDDEALQAAPSQSQSQPKKDRAQRTKKSKADVEMDVDDEEDSPPKRSQPSRRTANGRK